MTYFGSATAFARWKVAPLSWALFYMTAVKFPARNAEIVRRRQAGEEPCKIVRNMHLTRGVVLGVLYRAGMTDDLSPMAGKRTQRDAAPVTGTYICDPCSCVKLNGGHRTVGGGSGHCWHETLRARLEWQYGAGRAHLISLGADETAAGDLAAWNRLGSRRGRAA